MFGVLHPALLPSLPTDTASPVLTQMKYPQSNLWRSNCPAGRWIQAPLKEFAPITFSLSRIKCPLSA